MMQVESLNTVLEMRNAKERSRKNEEVRQLDLSACPYHVDHVVDHNSGTLSVWGRCGT